MLSAVILTRDNERTIARAVESLKGLAEELIVVDDGSTDRTLEIIRAIWPDAKFLSRVLDRFDAQRNFGLEHVKGEWTIMIDSDEELDLTLREAIRKEMRAPKAKAYGVYRLNRAFDRVSEEKLIRTVLFPSVLRFEHALHENIDVPLTYLPGRLIHNSWVDASDWLKDINNYSTHTAKKWLIENRNYSRFWLMCLAFGLPLYTFCQLYFGRKRYLNGFFVGFLYTLANATEWWFVILKYYEWKYLGKELSSGTIK